jgi:hypothetical protein
MQSKQGYENDVTAYYIGYLLRLARFYRRRLLSGQAKMWSHLLIAVHEKVISLYASLFNE